MNEQINPETDYIDKIQKLRWYDRSLSSFVRFVQPQAGLSALCVQCGPGLLARKVAKLGLCVTAIDGSASMVELATAHAKRAHLREFTVMTADVMSLPFPDETFDLVIAATLIHALEDPAGALKEMARTARRGGTVAILEPSLELRPERVLSFAAKNALTGATFKAFQAWCAEAQEQERFSVMDLERLYRKAGLAVPEIEEEMDRILLAAKAQKTQPAK